MDTELDGGVLDSLGGFNDSADDVVDVVEQILTKRT